MSTHFGVQYHMCLTLSQIAIEGFVHQSMTTSFLPKEQMIDQIMGLLQMKLMSFVLLFIFAFPAEIAIMVTYAT